jgi:predicted metalloprotease
LQRTVDKAEANAIQVRVELQADCLPPAYGRITRTKTSGARASRRWSNQATSAALRTAAAIGDDTLQRRSQGYVVPDSFRHGTSEQRQRWFANGYRNGTMSNCNTFGSQDP